MNRRIFVTTANEIQGRTIRRYLGIVRGIVVYVPGIQRSLAGAFSALDAALSSGGSVHEFEEFCEEARREAHARMVDQAGERGADAIIAMRYEANGIGERFTELLAYGTAVQLNSLDEVEPAEIEFDEPAPHQGE